MSTSKISLLISALSLSISLFLMFRQLYINRARIDIIQSNASHSVIFYSYDGSNRHFEGNIDLYPSSVKHAPPMRKVALAEVIITNKSALPITVLEFKINGSFPFTPYSKVLESIYATNSVSPITYTCFENIKYLQPEFTLQPYTSKRGFLFFWLFISDTPSITQSFTLTTTTSRKTFKTKIYFSEVLNSIKKDVHISLDKDGNIIETYHIDEDSKPAKQ